MDSSDGQRNYSDMVLEKAPASNGDKYQAPAFSTESEEAFRIFAIVGERATRPGSQTQ